MPIAAGSRVWMSRQLTAGKAKPGSPRGNAPTTATPWPSRPRASEATIAATTTTRAGGTFAASRRKATITASKLKSEEQSRPMRLVQLAGEFGEPGEEVVVFEPDAEELVELRGHQDQGRAGHVADEHGFGEEVCDRADPGAGSQQQQQPAEHSHRGGEDGGAGGIAARQRGDGAGNQQ